MYTFASAVLDQTSRRSIGTHTSLSTAASALQHAMCVFCLPGIKLDYLAIGAFHYNIHNPKLP